MPVQKWLKLFDQPDKFRRQPVRPSVLSDRQRAASRMPARSAIMSSLGMRMRFVQKMSALSGFRSIRANPREK